MGKKWYLYSYLRMLGVDVWRERRVFLGVVESRRKGGKVRGMLLEGMISWLESGVEL